MANKVTSVSITVSTDERQRFLRWNRLPRDMVEGYIWFAFENPLGDRVTLYADEAHRAASMADRAGCVELAARLRNLQEQCAGAVQ